MKRSLATILAALFIAAALASCSNVASDTSVGTNITLTSSDARDAAAWLTERLGAIPDRVVLGTDASAYGVDLSTLEDDGYIIRALGGEVALFARTPDGLDHAARRYAKAVEAGNAVADATYHEGYRVKKLTIAGNDVSEYAIIRADDSSECAATASSELATYIERACGAQLSQFTESEYEAAADKAARRIILTEGDASLGDEGFTISADEDGTLTIAGGIWRGVLYGVYDLLEDVGWRFIAPQGSYFDHLVPADRQEFLYEAEHIDLTAAINRTEIPSIPIRGGVGGLRQRNTYSTRYNAKYGGYGFDVRVCHGLQNNHDIIFSGEFEGLYEGWNDLVGFTVQPCFTNADILDAIDHYALESVRTRLEAGQKIGKEIVMVDVAQWDGGGWTFCTCKTCMKVKREEGCHTGAFLRMANRVAALLDENYPGVSAGILAYAGTDQLPRVTRPAHNVIVSFCYYFTDGAVSCQNHCISGEYCQDVWDSISNRVQARRLEEWLEVTDPKMVQIWYYPFVTGNRCYNTPLLNTLLDDMKYFADKKIGHVYYCMDRTRDNNNGLICEGLTEYLGARYMWNADMTEEESLDVIREWFEIVCGKEAGGELFELAMFAERAGDLAGCWCSFAGGDSVDRVSYDYVAKHADELWDKCLRASSLADDKSGEEFAEKYAAGSMFMVVRSLYDDMYVNGTDAERSSLAGRYRAMWERMAKYELYPFDDEYVPETFDPDVDPRSWLS